MRVLFVTIPEKTFFLYQVPLAWALRTAGHEVRVASQPGFARVITQAGLTAVPVGNDIDLNRFPRWALSPQAREASRAGLPAPYDAAADAALANWDRMLRGYDEMVSYAHKPENFPMIASLVEFARSWRPDLVVWEPFSYAGAIAAKACGSAHARLLWSVDVFAVARDRFLRLRRDRPAHDRPDPLAEWLGAYGRKYGFEFSEDMVTGQVTIDQLPACLTLPADLDYMRMQYVPYGGPAVVPRWLWEPAARPRVALTMGITATDHFAGYTFRPAEILDALADLDIELVATIAEAEQRKLGRIPRNTRAVPYVPLHALVPTCAAVIHHGGAATLATTALHPVPQLVLGYHFDEPILARNLAAHGAGLELAPEAATGANVRASLQRLLDEPAFRDRAEALRDEFRAQPAPNDLVPHLEDLVARHRTGA